MISELCNSLFLTYLASEYLVADAQQDDNRMVAGGRSNHWKQRLTPILLTMTLLVNILDRVVGMTDWFHSATELLHVFSWPFKILLAASCYVGALYVDINRKSLFVRISDNMESSNKNSYTSDAKKSPSSRNKRMPFRSVFLPKVGWAFLKVLPAYPFLAVLISFGFLFVINIWEFLQLPEEWLNMPIYYGTLYGPFAYTYVHVKQQVVCYESNALPT